MKRLLPFTLVLLAGILVGFSASRLRDGRPAKDVDEPALNEKKWQMETSALERTLTDVREEERLDAKISPRAAESAAIDRMSLEQIQAKLQQLNNAAPGPKTDRLEQELVERWSALDPRGAADYAAQAYAQGANETVLRKAAEALASVDPAAASAWAAALESPLVRDTALRHIYRKWSERNSAAAAASLTSLPIGSAQLVAASASGKHFADANLSGALQWVNSLDGAVQTAAMRSVLSRWAITDPAAAGAWAMQQNSPGLRSEAMKLLASDWAQRDPAAALAYANAIESPAARVEYVQAALQRYALSDPQSAAAWLAGAEASPYVKAAIGGITSQWAAFDPGAASGWAESIPDPALRDRAVAAVSRSWGNTDPAQAAQWISGLADSKARDAATAAFSSVLAKSDPATAAQWAAGITDAAARNQSLTQVVRDWKRADLPAATAFLQSSSLLPAALREKLLR